MTELETLQRAKMYIDKLANGIDPVTDSEMPGDTVMNHVRLSRCFFYVSDILRQVIENGGEVGKKAKKEPFSITGEEASRIPVTEERRYLSYFCKDISEAAAHQEKRQLSHKVVSDWLVAEGYLSVEQAGDKTRKRVTDKGQDIGISEEQRVGQFGSYIAILYNARAQRLILDYLPAILEEAADKG